MTVKLVGIPLTLRSSLFQGDKEETLEHLRETQNEKFGELNVLLLEGYRIKTSIAVQTDYGSVAEIILFKPNVMDPIGIEGEISPQFVDKLVQELKLRGIQFN